MVTVLDPRLDVVGARTALDVLTVADTELAVEEHAAALAHRRIMREPKGRADGAPQPRCSACHRFRSSPGGPCPSCGFDRAQGWPG